MSIHRKSLDPKPSKVIKIKSIPSHLKYFINKTKGPNNTILEISAKNELITREFIKYDYAKIILNDDKITHLDIMKKKFKKNKNIDFKLSNFPYDISITPESIDGIYCMNAISFLNSDKITKFFNNCFLMLKPGGIITISAIHITNDLSNNIKSPFDIKSMIDIFEKHSFFPLTIELCKNIETNIIAIAKKPNNL